MTAIEYLDCPPPGWFALSMMREKARKRDWVALIVDVHPDELKHCRSKIAFLYVHPDEYRPDRNRIARESMGPYPREVLQRGRRLGRSLANRAPCSIAGARLIPNRL